MSVTVVQECAEAICEGLYHTDFEFLGETEGGRITWFTRGVKPLNVRVSVRREDKFVSVLIEWPNISTRQVVKGQQFIEIKCENVQRADMQAATTAALTRCLEIFRDVLTQTGVAGLEGIKDLKFEG